MNSLLSAAPLKRLDQWRQLTDLTRLAAGHGSAYPVDLEGFLGSSPAFFAAALARELEGAPLVLVVPGDMAAQDMERDLGTLIPDAVIRTLPWWGTVPYRPVPRGSKVFGERSAFLAHLAAFGEPHTEARRHGEEGERPHAKTQRRKERTNYFSPHASAPLGEEKSPLRASAPPCEDNPHPTFFIITQRALQTPVPPPEYLRSLLVRLKTGDSFDPPKLAAQLANLGYIRVPRVSVAGEFALRGEVLDIFVAGGEKAFRVSFDFDAIGKIRVFDPISQSTVSPAEEFTVYPMKEVISGEEGDGEEWLYPTLFPERHTVLDYLERETPVLFLDYDRMVNAQANILAEYEGLYKRENLLHRIPKPEDILLPLSESESQCKRGIRFRGLAGNVDDGRRFAVELDAPRSFFGNINFLKETITEAQSDGWEILVFAESENQASRIGEVLKDCPPTIVPHPLSAGFGVPAVKLLIIQENEIFGRKKRIPKTLGRVKSAVIDTFVELNPGDYVVHVNYGIGRFLGIERVKALGHERDYIKLEYADDETVFIPIEQVNLVQRYIGNEGDAPRLDTLGSKSWENRKNRVKKAVEDMAKRLIDLYSRRKASRGFPFQKDTEWQAAFEAQFPWDETADQLSITTEVKADMEKPVPMDRLICGDVGYGKTEIALRAAFKAVMNGKQAAFLAPTTLLAEQHYETCLERFAGFPVEIAQLSRMVSRKEQLKTLEQLASGRVDIIVGTHRIIQKDVRFKDLGLLVVDEEQRFGVKDKERLKELKANIDCLAMSATPIPRTLHMSLLKIRDMSLLITPPANRQAIETVIAPYRDEQVARVIRAEAERGGQVFFLHNKVETLEETRIKLERLLPEILIGTAHGKMGSEELDDVFRRFKMGGFHVLCATTIIENGIDIPNVNTIIIDRADMFGVSQLYQLRGRVGRSDRKAYAYLLYPENSALSDIAMKRLQVISDFTELGSG
ncbi:MAG: transcription-repair coupling factor, partial [Spirochaetaceae bacterium]|nr:transcription-repair coupling factor [Spirochaetaceae bacterium]